MSPSADFLNSAEPNLKFEYEAFFDILGDVMKFNESFTLPLSSVNTIAIPYKNRVKQIAGSSMHQQSTLKIRSFVSPSTAAKCWKWYRKVYPSPGVVGHPGDYKTGGYVKLLDGRGSYIASWQYQGCWPSKIEMGEGSQADMGTLIEISLTIDFDEVTGPEN